MARKPTTLKALKAAPVEEDLSQQDKEEAELIALRNKVADLEDLLQNPPSEEEYEDTSDSYQDEFYDDFDEDVPENRNTSYDYPPYKDRNVERPLRKEAPKPTLLNQLKAVLKWIFDMVFGFCAIVTCAILGILICFIPIGAFEAFSVYLLRSLGVHI